MSSPSYFPPISILFYITVSF
uniref:Uncharacterized protein n=1 Tax=Rhizophora mucronata TaxID=61149 RepID=A0A2P2NX60_RHIMU